MYRKLNVCSALVSAALVVLLLSSGCATRSSPSPSAATDGNMEPVEPLASGERVAATVPTSRHDRFWMPPHFTSEEDKVHFYASRLADRGFVDVYGGEEHPRVWYIAAEQLGQIGSPAVPVLYALIDTRDEYELMLVLYALQLATQDARLMAETGGEYVQLTTSLEPAANSVNREIALRWWEEHGWRWQ